MYILTLLLNLSLSQGFLYNILLSDIMDDLLKKENSALYEIISFFKDTKSAVVSFSGGKDSLVALDLARRAGIKKAIFSDTTIEDKITLKYIINLQNFIDVSIDILKPKVDFFTLFDEYGPPSRRYRWCCPTIKYPQIVEYARKNNIKYMITGLRKSESNIRSKYEIIGINPMTPNVKEFNPIIDWTEKDVFSYIKNHNLPLNPIYNLGFKRNGCVICPYKKISEIEKYKTIEPELLEKFEKKLQNYVSKINPYDPKKFLLGGWVLWTPKQKKLYAGIINNSGIIISNKILELDNNPYALINLADTERDLITALEKRINCTGCGACISFCPSGALFLEHGKINVNNNLCSHCKLCISNKYLRGACTARNYRVDKFSIKIRNKEDFNEKT
jgi:phosphoadenosine phosphosulfate reductase